MTAVAEEDVNRFYHDFYQFLSSAGVDSVKTDAQFFVDELDDAPDRRQLIKAYQDAWSINQLRFFSGKAISCMSQTPQIIFHSQLPSNKPRILLRNSDDFFPEVPASHPWHIFCNAHNAIFNQYLNILPDWDMFQTSHEWASFHAAARCVSGGPIYITDVPGKHDVDLINQMTGNTPRGDTVILRPHTVGKSTSAYNSYDDAVLLKVSTFVGMAHSGVSILGVFNCTQHPLTELIGLDQFPGAETGTYIIRSHITGQVSNPTSVDSGAAFVHLEVPVIGWDILSAFPLQSFKLERGKHGAEGPAEISVANLGLLGKMTGAAGIINSDAYVERDSGKLRVWTSLKVLGTYGKSIITFNMGDSHHLLTYLRYLHFRSQKAFHRKRLYGCDLRSANFLPLRQDQRAVREHPRNRLHQGMEGDRSARWVEQRGRCRGYHTMRLTMLASLGSSTPPSHRFLTNTEYKVPTPTDDSVP